MTLRALLASSPVALLVVACASVPHDAGFDEVRRLTSERISQRVFWRLDGMEDDAVGREVAALLASSFSADAAVQVALLENRRLQATYERLGIAQAELVQAGLLHNPVFAVQARFPDGPPSGSNVELGVVQDFLDVLLRSARKGIAQAQLEETQLSVAAEVIDFAAEVRRSYFLALGAEQVSQMRRLVVDAAQASAELAQRLHDAGNASDLQLASELGLYESARVAWARADAERLAAREDLRRQMGLWGPGADWTFPDGLPDVPSAEAPLGMLEARAIARRLDLAAARRKSETLALALGVSRDWRFLGMAEVGVNTERDTDGQWVTGPQLSLALPLFDQGQASGARLASELRQADNRVVALAVEIRSEVRAARDRLVALRRLAEHYREVIIPMREATVGLTQEEYNYMLVGAFELIAAKQAEYDAYQEYVEVVRDYWITRGELERALGGGALGDLATTPATVPERTVHDVHARHEGD